MATRLSAATERISRLSDRAEKLAVDNAWLTDEVERLKREREEFMARLAMDEHNWNRELLLPAPMDAAATAAWLRRRADAIAAALGSDLTNAIIDLEESIADLENNMSEEKTDQQTEGSRA